MRRVGRLCADLHSFLEPLVKPGISTLELDALAEEFIKKNGGVPAFKGYLDFPNTFCASVNDQVVHCTPSAYKLQDGDIVTIDLGASLDGFMGDTAKTYLVGNVKPEVRAFVQVGYDALMAGIANAKAGKHVADISNSIARLIKSHGHGVVERYIGHGIGRQIHEPPQVPNTEQSKPGAELVPGMVICIEPILTLYPSGKINEISKWEIRTVDGSPAVHWEHMVEITEDAPRILTLRPEEQFLKNLKEEERDEL